MKNKSLKQQLQDRINEDREALSRLEHDEWVANNAQHVGQWFKYRNCYSLPQKASDYWWAYKKVLNLNASINSFESFEFQTDRDGKIEIEHKQHGYLSSWLPCTEVEAKQAWKLLMNKLIKVTP